MKATTAVLGAALVISTGVALAEDKAAAGTGLAPQGWYVAPMFSWTHADKNRGTSDGYGGVLALGHRGEIAGIELSGLYTRFPTGGAQLTGGSVGLVAGPFFDQPVLARFTGLISFGLLKEKNIPALMRNTSAIFGDLGVGYVQPLQLFGFDWGLRSELRYRYDYEQPPRPEGTPTSFSEWVINVGLQIPLSRAERVSPPKETPVVVVPPVVPADDDGDGVPNAADQCPGTPKGTAVNEAGCVAETAAAAPLAKAGDTLVLEGVTFQSGKAELAPESLGVLDDAAKKLLAKPDVKVEVGGHTDSSGQASSNKNLSQQRAEAVRDYLIGQGVPAERLSAVGYGDTRPVADNATPEGKAKNRRVELKVVG